MDEIEPIMLHLPANVVSKGLSVTNTTRQHFLFFEMTYSVGNRLCEQKIRAPAHDLHFEVLRAIRDPSARHRRPFSTYPGTGQRLASNCPLTYTNFSKTLCACSAAPSVRAVPEPADLQSII